MSASNVQKTPLLQSLNTTAKKASGNTAQNLGKILPCSVTAVTGSIVTVKFEVSDPTFTFPPATMAVLGAEYVRMPIQVGCKGVAIPADVYTGAITGLGAGTADLTPQPNLSNLIFVPCGNANWFAVNGNLLVLYGPQGVEIMTPDGSTTITVTENNVVIKATNVSISNGGTIQPVKLADGTNSTVLKAQ